jgi:hypothetical protein
MVTKRFMLAVVSVSLVFVWTETANAAAYPLAAGGGSGLQYGIGGGLPLPIQAKITATGTAFPPLLVPPVGGAATPTGIVLQTDVRTGTNPKDIRIVYPVLSKPAGYKKIGVFNDNPALYQVATNLSVVFPATSHTAMFSLGTSQQTMTGRTGPTTVQFTTGLGSLNNITYSNALNRRFGGPGRFFVGNPGTKPAGALATGVNATVWAIAIKGSGSMQGNPPCTHPALVPPFPGTNRTGCVAAIIQAVPDPFADAAVWGATVEATNNTPGGTPMAIVTTPNKPMKGPKPGVNVLAANASGLILFSAPAGPLTGLTNMASSTGYPWTTGMIVVSAPLAGGVGEKWTLTGMDSRVNGVGTIQLVAGTLSRRFTTKANANRSWLRLNIPEPSAALGTVGALAMLALCHGLARRRSR